MKAETEQYYLPKTPKKIADTFVVLRQPKPDRDKDYSALFDSVMSAVCSQLKEHAPDAFNIVWTSSLFPERISQNVLRLVEQEVIIQIEKDRERVKLNAKIKVISEYEIIVDPESIDNTPINLEL